MGARTPRAAGEHRLGADDHVAALQRTMPAGTSVMFLIARVAKTSEQAGIATSLGNVGWAFMSVSAASALATLLDLNPVAAMLRWLGITAAHGGPTDLGVPTGSCSASPPS